MEPVNISLGFRLSDTISLSYTKQISENYIQTVYWVFDCNLFSNWHFAFAFTINSLDMVSDYLWAFVDGFAFKGPKFPILGQFKNMRIIPYRGDVMVDLNKISDGNWKYLQKIIYQLGAQIKQK